MWWKPTVLICGALLVSGCNNACQQVCVRMAAYADECGFKIPDAELDACVDGNSSTSLAAEDLQTCRDFGDAEMIRKQWDCDDLEAYWAVSPLPGT